MATEFRKVFRYDQRLFWYPGHMAKSLRLLKNRFLSRADIIIEVRDARAPLSSINKQFEVLTEECGVSNAALGVAKDGRERLIVYNKADLANANMQAGLKEGLKVHMGQEAVFTSAMSAGSVQPLLDFARRKAEVSGQPWTTLVLVGMPNVGKSSLLNALRRAGTGKGRCASVAPHAGHTRSFASPVTVLSSEGGRVHVVDSPGMLDPGSANAMAGLRVALTGGSKDRLAVADHVADYLLFRLNQSPALRSRYTSLLAMSAPVDAIHDLLPHVSRRFGLLAPGGSVDTESSTRAWIQLYRSGKLGRMTLDDCSPAHLESFFTWLKQPVEVDDLQLKNAHDALVSDSEAEGLTRLERRRLTKQRVKEARMTEESISYVR